MFRMHDKNRRDASAASLTMFPSMFDDSEWSAEFLKRDLNRTRYGTNRDMEMYPGNKPKHYCTRSFHKTNRGGEVDTCTTDYLMMTSFHRQYKSVVAERRFSVST